MDVGVLEAKNRFSELIERAERGEEVVITRHGKPAAKLIAATPPYDRAEAQAAMDRMAERRKLIQPPVTLEEIKAMIADGRE